MKGNTKFGRWLCRFAAFVLAFVAANSAAAEDDTSSGSSLKGAYFIKSNDSCYYLTRGGLWGTELTYGEVGTMFFVEDTTVTVDNTSTSAYVLRTADLYTASGGTIGKVSGPTSAYTDANSGSWWTFEETSSGSGVYYIKNSNGKYLMPSNTNTSYYWISETETQSEAPTFVLLSRAGYKTSLASRLDTQATTVATKAGINSDSSSTISSVSTLEAVLADSCAINCTDSISNPTYDSNDGWSLVTTQTGGAYLTALSTPENNTQEFYDNTGGAEQKITGLEEGIYKVTVNAMCRPLQYGSSYYTTYPALDTLESAPSYAYANTSSGENLTQVAFAVDGTNKALNSRSDFYSAATGENNDYLVTFYVHVPSDGALTIGFVQPARAGGYGSWTIATNWTLTRYLSTEKYYTDSLSVLIDSATNITGLTEGSTEATNLTSALATAKLKSKSSPADSLQSAYSALYAAIEAANKALSIPAAEVTDGNYYLQAYAKAGTALEHQFLGRGGAWGGEAVVQDFGNQMIVAVSSSTDKTYTLRALDRATVLSTLANYDGYFTFTASAGSSLSGASSANWRFVENNAADSLYYLVNSEDYYLTTATEATYGYDYITSADDSTKAIIWKLISEATYDSILLARDSIKQAEAVALALKQHEVDSLGALSVETSYTDSISGADYTSSDGWTIKSTEKNYASSISSLVKFDTTNGIFCFQNEQAQISQEITGLAQGLYRVDLLGMNAAFRFAGYDGGKTYKADEVAEENAYFYANTSSCPDNFKKLMGYTDYSGYSSVTDSMSYLTYDSCYKNTLYVYVGEGETLTIGAVHNSLDDAYRARQSPTGISGHQYLSDWQLTLLEPAPTLKNPSALDGDTVTEGTYYLQAISHPSGETDDGNSVREKLNYKFLSRGGYYGWQGVVGDFGVAQVLTASDSIATGNYYSLYSADLQAARNSYSYCYLADDGSRISTGEGTKGQWRLVEVNSGEDEESESVKYYYLVGLSVSDSISTTTDNDGNTTTDTTQVYTDYYVGMASNEVNDYTYYYITAVEDTASAVIWQLISEDTYDGLVEARLNEQAKDIYTLLKEEVGAKIADSYAVTTLADLATLVAAGGEKDMTSAITNANYNGTDGWTYNSICPFYKKAYTGSINTSAYHIYEAQHRDIGVYTATGRAAQIVQHITGLEQGLYKVNVAAMQTTVPISYYPSRTALPSVEENLSVVFASAGNDTLFKQVKSYADGNISFSSDLDDDYEFAMYSHERGAYDNELYVYVGEDDTLSIGVTMPGIARHSSYTSIYVGPWTLTKVLVGKDIMEPDYTPGDGWFVETNGFDPGSKAENRVATFTFALPEAFNMTDETALQVLSTSETCSLTITQDGKVTDPITTTASSDNLSGTNKDTLTLSFNIPNSTADPQPGTKYTVTIPKSIYGYKIPTTSANSRNRRASYRSDATTANTDTVITFSVSPVANYLDQSVILMEHRDTNFDEYRFLNQGGAWTTEAIRGEVGRPVEISVYEGAHVIRNIDLSDYWYHNKDVSFYMYYVHNDVPGFYMDSTSLYGITKSHLFQFVPTGATSASNNKLFYLCQEDNRYYDWNGTWTVSDDDTLHYLGTASYTNELSQYTYQYMKRYTPTLNSSDTYSAGTANAYSYDNVANLTAPSEAIAWEILTYAQYQDTIRHMQYNSQPYRSVYAYDKMYTGILDTDSQELDPDQYFVDYGKITEWENNAQLTEGTSFNTLTDTLEARFYRIDWSKWINNTDFSNATGWTQDTKFIAEGQDGFTFDTITLSNYNNSYFTDDANTIVTVGGVGGYSQSVSNLPAGFYRLSVDALYLPTGLDNFLSTSHTIDTVDINQAPTCFAFLQAQPASSSSSITSAITRVGAVATLDTVTYVSDGDVKTGLYTYPYGLESTLGQTEVSSSKKRAAVTVDDDDDDDDSSTTSSTANFREDFLRHFNTSFYIYLPADYTLIVGFAAENAVNGGDADGSTMVTSDWTLTYYPNVPCALEDPTLSMTDGEVVPSGTTITEFTAAYPNAWTVDTCYAAIYGLYDYTSADTYADQQKTDATKTSFTGRILDWGDSATAPSFTTDDNGDYTYDSTTGFLEYSSESSVTAYTGTLSVETYADTVDATVDAITDEVKEKKVTIDGDEETISDFYHERGLKLKLSDITKSGESSSTSTGLTLEKGHMYTLEIPADVYGFVYANDSSYWRYDDWDEYDSTDGNSAWATLTVGTTDAYGKTTDATQVKSSDGTTTDFYTKRYANEAILVTFYVADIEGAWYLKVVNTATDSCLSDDGTFTSNVTDSLYLNRGGNYGTQAVIDTIGAPVEIQAVTGGYNIRFLDDYRTATVMSVGESNDTTYTYPYSTYLFADFTKGTDLYVDGYLHNEAVYGARFGISRYGMDADGNWVYALTDANEQSDNNGNEIYRSYLDSLTLDVATTGGSETPVVWQLVKIDDHNNYIKALPENQVKGVAHTAYSGEAKLQYGSYLDGDSCRTDTAKFAAALDSKYYTPTAITLSNANSEGAEAFGQGGGTATSPYTLTLTDMPGGVYKFTSDAFFRATDRLVTDTLTQQVSTTTNDETTTIGYGDLGRGLAYISANDQSVQVKSLGEDMAASVASGSWTTGTGFDSYYQSITTGKYYANQTSYALATFANGQYDNSVYVYIEDGDDLTLAVTKANGYNASNWLYTANATLTWYSDRLDVKITSTTGYFGLYYQDYGLQIPRDATTGEDSLKVWTAKATYSSDYTFTTHMYQLKNNGVNNGKDAFDSLYTIVPPHTPVYLQGTYGTTYSLRKRNCSLDSIKSNLVGTETGATLEEENYKYYQLTTKAGSTDASTTGFYWYSGATQGSSITLKAHKVALALPTTTEQQVSGSSVNIVWHYYGEETGDEDTDDATAITDVNSDSTLANVRYGVYTLTGIRVADEVDSTLPAGIYVIDGKKTLIK